MAWAITTYGREFAIATSFQKEGMVIVDLAARAVSGGACRVFTLDTGRLPEETYGIMETVRQRYGIAVERVTPESGRTGEYDRGARGEPLLFQS